MNKFKWLAVGAVGALAVFGNLRVYPSGRVPAG